MNGRAADAAKGWTGRNAIFLESPRNTASAAGITAVMGGAMSLPGTFETSTGVSYTAAFKG